MNVSKPQRIPRPRHLFPELSAFLIEGKRASWRTERSLRRAVGRIPVWITGSLAGIAGIMLTVSLFFVHEPQLQAAATPTPVLIPEREPEPTLAAPSSPRGAHLLAKFIHTFLPGVWDENHHTTRTSAPPRTPGVSSSLPRDQWKSTMLREGAAPEFTSYLIRAAGLPANWPLLPAADVVPPINPFPTALTMGILLEKTGDLQGTPAAPLTYQISIRNASGSAIDNLSVRERISTLVRVADVVPPAGISGDELVWNIEHFPADAVRTFQITLVPETAGEIETLTRVIPLTRIAASVLVKNPPAPEPEIRPFEPASSPPVQPAPAAPGAPELNLTYTDVRALKQGETLSLIFTVTNIGTAAAEDVTLYVQLSGEFEHRYGKYVKNQVGTLQPGQSRRALLQATARDPGTAHLNAALTMQGNQLQLRELKIPIQGGQPGLPNRLQPVVHRPVLDQSQRLTVLEPAP